MAKRCVECNLEYNRGDFCIKCGHSLQQVPKPEVQQVPEMQQVPEPEIQQMPKPEIQQSDDNSDEERVYKKDKKPPIQFSAIKVITSILVVLLLVVLGALTYYLNTSQIDQAASRKSRDYEWSKIVDQAVDGNEIDLTIDIQAVNQYLSKYNNNDDVQLPLFIKITDVYYNDDYESFVASLTGPIIHTSLLFDYKLYNDNEKTLSITNVRIGDRELPVPKFLYNRVINEALFQVTIPEQLISVDEFTVDSDGLKLNADFNDEYLKNLVGDKLKEEQPGFIKFLVEEKNIEIPAIKELEALDETRDVESVLKELMIHYDKLGNWALVLDDEKNNLLIEQYNATVPKSKRIVKADYLANNSIKRAEYLSEFDQVSVLSRLPQDAIIVYQAIVEMHKKNGVPAYIVASNGRPYSRTLMRYITAEDLVKEGLLSSDTHYKLMASGSDVIIGTQLSGRYSYISIGSDMVASKTKIVDTKEKLASSLGADSYNDKAQLLQITDEERKNVSSVIRSLENSDGDPYIRYLSSDGSSAFVVYSSKADYQAINAVLLTKADDASNWKMIKKMTANDNIQISLSQYIEDRSFNTRVLPPFELTDFTVNNYQSEEIDKLTQFLIVNEKVTDKANVQFLSRVGDNLFMVFDSGEKVLITFEEGSKTIYEKLLIIENQLPIMGYVKEFKPHRMYDNYFPIFTMLQE